MQGPLSRFGDTAANAGTLSLLESYEATAHLNVGLKTLVASASAAAFRIVLMPVDATKTIMQVSLRVSTLLHEVTMLSSTSTTVRVHTYTHQHYNSCLWPNLTQQKAVCTSLTWPLFGILSTCALHVWCRLSCTNMTCVEPMPMCVTFGMAPANIRNLYHA